MAQQLLAAAALVAAATTLAAGAPAVARSPGRAAAAALPRHTSCGQPLVGGMNISFWASATFTSGGAPQIMLGMGTGPTGHVPATLLLNVAKDGSCVWQQTSAQLTDPRTSGCAVALSPSQLMFGGGHNNSAAYVGTIDVFTKTATGTVTRDPGSLSLPVGRELVGCAAVGDVVLFAGGKPPHPPAPIGETKVSDCSPTTAIFHWKVTILC